MNRLRLALAAALAVSAASVAVTAPAVAQTGGSTPQVEQSSSGCGFKAKPAATS
jgi:hypothetical protein